MARTFAKDTSKYMSLGSSAIGTIMNGATAVSVHARIRPASVSAGVNDNNILAVIVGGTTVGLALSIDGTTSKLRCSARSVVGDARQALTGGTALSMGVEYSVGVVVDFTGKTITLYLNGVADGTVGTLAFANNTYTQGTPTDNDAVGGFRAPAVATTDQLDGAIGHVAVWTSALSGANFVSLAQATPASAVGTPAWFLPIGGAASPELATVGTPSGTITGTLPAVLAIDTASRSAYPASNPITVSHTIVGGGANRLLVVGITFSAATPPSISSVTYGGVAMTQAALNSDVPAGYLTAIYVLVAPTAGTANIVVTLSAGSGGFAAFGLSFTGVDPTTPIDVTANGPKTTNATYTETITTIAANVYVVDAVAQNFSGTAGTLTPGAGQTAVLNSVSAAGFSAAAGSYKSIGAAGAQTLTWVATHSGVTESLGVLVSVQPVSAGGGPAPLKRLLLLGCG